MGEGGGGGGGGDSWLEESVPCNKSYFFLPSSVNQKSILQKMAQDILLLLLMIPLMKFSLPDNSTAHMHGTPGYTLGVT